MSPLRVLPATKTPHHRLCVPSQNGLVRDIPHPHSLIWPGIFAGGGSMGSPLLSRNSTGPSTMYGPAGFQVMMVGGVESGVIGESRQTGDRAASSRLPAQP